MNFDLSEEQLMIRGAVRDFAEQEIKPLAHDLDEKGEGGKEKSILLN